MTDFEKLTFNHVASAKLLRRAFMKTNCLASASIIKRVSSAYCTIRKSRLDYKSIGLLINPLFIAEFTKVYRKSAASTKSRGERGSPCLTPLLQWIVLPGTPFRRILVVPDEKMLGIQEIQVWPKPLCLRMSRMNSCSSLSKVFSKSSLRMITFFLEWWQMCRYSKAHARQSCIVLDFGQRRNFSRSSFC